MQQFDSGHLGLRDSNELNAQIQTNTAINGTERSPEGSFSCRGMLDFHEEYKLDVILLKTFVLKETF